MSRQRGRALAYDLMEEGILSAQAFAEAAIQWLTSDEVDELLRANDMIPSEMYNDEDD